MIYDPVDFSEEKKELKNTLGSIQQGEDAKDKDTVNFTKVVRDIEEFIDSASRGLNSLCPRAIPIQTNTLICLKVFNRIKNQEIIPKAAIEEFLESVEQDLGIPARKYLNKLIFKGENPNSNGK